MTNYAAPIMSNRSKQEQLIAEIGQVLSIFDGCLNESKIFLPDRNDGFSSRFRSMLQYRTNSLIIDGLVIIT